MSQGFTEKLLLPVGMERSVGIPSQNDGACLKSLSKPSQDRASIEYLKASNVIESNHELCCDSFIKKLFSKLLVFELSKRVSTF